MAGKRPRTSMRKNAKKNKKVREGKDKKASNHPHFQRFMHPNEVPQNPLRSHQGQGHGAVFSHGDEGGMGSLFGNQKLMILSYYKGTHFPMTPTLTYGEWEARKKVFEKLILSSMMRGATIPDMIGWFSAQMDRMEKFMFDWGETHPSGLIQGKEIQADLVEFMKEELGGVGQGEASLEDQMWFLCNLWYCNVYCLIRFGHIKDDDKNGWIIMPEACGEWMKSM